MPRSCEGLVPAIIQDDDTRQVLMLGYLNEEAFDKTVADGPRHILQPHERPAVDQRRNERQLSCMVKSIAKGLR